MWHEKQDELLRDEIEAVLAYVPDANRLYDLVRESLAKTGRGLAAKTAYDTPWPLLPLIVCEAISGDYGHALPVAVALQFLMAAGDVFDDIEDADSTESLSARHGPAVATNAATALLILAEMAITQLKDRGLKDSVTICVMKVVNSFYITACAGQHLDLSMVSETAVSEDIYLKITSMKSASQIECACYIGALLATDKQELIDLFARFGHNLGMAAQITNDIHGIIRESDIMKYKITLPIVYALAQTDGEVRNQLENAFVKQSESMPNPTQIRDLLFRTGAIHYAMIKMEFYKQQALDILSEIERAGANVKRLRLFLE